MPLDVYVMVLIMPSQLFSPHSPLQVDPKTTESVRGASRLMTDKEAKMAKEYQALKERNQLMEAQLESMR